MKNKQAKYCQEYFDFSLPSVLWTKRVAKFEVNFECFVCAIIVWFRLYCLMLVVSYVCLVNKILNKDSEKTVYWFYSCVKQHLILIREQVSKKILSERQTTVAAVGLSVK